MSEQETNLNTPNRLRQRLVGALVVVALAVLVLPLWLDGGGLKTPTVLPVPPTPVVDHPAKITVPQPTPAQQSTLNNPPASFLSKTEPKAPSSSEPSQPESGHTDAPTKPETPAPVDDASGKHQPDLVPPSPPKEAPAVTPPSPPKPEASVESKPQSAPQSASAHTEEWVVQLGSFSDELNARGLAKSVKDAGFKVDIYPLFAKKGTVWRVRVGPFATRALAVKTTIHLRERLGRDGLVMPK